MINYLVLFSVWIPAVQIDCPLLAIHMFLVQPQGTIIIYNYRCNRLRCPLARMSGLQCYNMGHNGHGINLYGVSITLMEN